MNKKTLPVFALLLLVIICIAVLVKNLAAPAPSLPAAQYLTASSSTLSAVQSQPASGSDSVTDASPKLLRVIALKAPRGIINAEVASTSLEQAKGLGDRKLLAAGRGMLFPFTYPGDYGFWMKDMHFPIDMVWISSDKKVAGVTLRVFPETYPTVFYPPAAISYVLELNAGEADAFGIATGTQLAF